MAPKSATMVNVLDRFGKSPPHEILMMTGYFVRIGSLAEVHTASGETRLTRGRRVIVRTDRGVELGQVVGPCGPASQSEGRDVRIIRPTTEEDELLIRRLERHKREAVEACRDELSKSGSSAMLLDVDQLFDGGTLIMHFLGPVDELAQTITKQVAERYESIVRSRHFSKLLSDGCGPGCGTKDSASGASGGCGGGCAGCAVAAACQ